MRAKILRKLSATLLSLLLSETQALLASSPTCPGWSSKTTMTQYQPNGQPGLVAFNGKLILTWGDQSTGYLNSMVSTDGVNWTNHEVLSSFPKVYSSVANPAPPPYVRIPMMVMGDSERIVMSVSDAS